MITLYAFEPAFGLPSASPFVVKTMIHLTIAKQPYDIEIAFDLESAPKGKLPYIRDDDRLIADSELIRQHLETRYGVDFDPGLSPREVADGVAFTRLVEDHLYWCALYDHWHVDEHWAIIKPLLFNSLPPDQLDAVAGAVREQILRDLHGQGLGRHNHEELMTFAKNNLDALADRLGGGPFWFGDSLTSADAAIAPQIASIAGDPTNGPISRVLKAHPSLIAYAKRVLETALPEQMTKLAA